MNQPKKDARQATLGIRSAADMLRKLEWNLQQLNDLQGKANCEYAAVDVAMTAWHVVDWIASDVEERKRWPRIISELGLNLAPTDSRKKKLRTLQDYAVQNAQQMAIFRQIANASKHRDLGELDEDISAVVDRLKTPIHFGDDGELIDEYSSARAEFPVDGGRAMNSILLVGREVQGWLAWFVDRCTIALDDDPAHTNPNVHWRDPGTQ